MYLKVLLVLLFLLAMPGIGRAQSYEIVTIHTRAFLDSQNGIIRLIDVGSVCRDADNNRQRQCVSQANRSIVQDIARSVGEYTSRNHLILFDADSHYEEYRIVDSEVCDITKEFIAYYNSAHPRTQSNKSLDASGGSVFRNLIRPAMLE